MKLIKNKEPKKVLTEEEKAEKKEKIKEICLNVAKGIGLFAAGAVAVLVALAVAGNPTTDSEESTDSENAIEGNFEEISDNSTEE